MIVEVETRIAKVQDDKNIIDKTEEKINRLNSFLIDNLGNKMKLLKEEMKIIDLAMEKMSRFNVMAEEAEEKVKHFEEEVKKADVVSSILVKNRQLQESAKEQMEEI